MFVNLMADTLIFISTLSLSFACLKSLKINISIGKQVKASTETPQHQPTMMVGMGDSSPQRTEAHSRPHVDMGVPLSLPMPRRWPLLSKYLGAVLGGRRMQLGLTDKRCNWGRWEDGRQTWRAGIRQISAWRALVNLARLLCLKGPHFAPKLPLMLLFLSAGFKLPAILC